jgi:membrane protein DedA with SNARE-associated domain
MQPQSIQTIIKTLESIALQTPLEIFVFMGMFVDEIFPPIPSLFMLIIAGAIAKTQNHSLLYLLVYLSLIGAAGKTLGAWFMYILGDKGEHFMVKHFGKAIGVSHREIEDLSSRLNKGWKDAVVLFLARAIPIFPTTPVSVICGILKIDIKTYIIASFAGTWIRSMFFLFVGYGGLMNYNNIGTSWTNAESIAQIIFIALFIGAYVWYKKRKRQK